MLRPVVVNVNFSIDDPVRLARFIHRQNPFYRYDVAITSISVFVGFSILILFLSNDFASMNWLGVGLCSALPAIVVGILVYLLHEFLQPILSRRRVRKYFESSPMGRESKTITFSDEGIAIIGELGSASMAWGAITRAVEAPNDFLFYTGNEKYPFYIPKRVISSDDLDALRATLRLYVGERLEGV